MKKAIRHLIRAGIVLGALGCIFAFLPRGEATEAAALERVVVPQWTFLGTSGPLRARTEYTLRNEPNGKSLIYKKREYGIELDWSSSSSLANVSLARQRSSADPIAFGELVALSVRSGGYLKYEEREYGINLVWSSTPVYEFELAGGVVGTFVRAGERVALYNTTHGDYVVYAEREYGINLRWYSDAIGEVPLGILSGKYPPVPFPPALRSPSGEPGQAILAGTAEHIKVFHGGTADELDWHVYIRPDQETRSALASHLRHHAKGAGSLRGLESDEGADLAYAEWMVLDGYKSTFTDDRFYSADVGRALDLPDSAWSYSALAASQQNLSGVSKPADNSGLVLDDAWVYLQGPLVNDSAHGFRLEIHPLDSIAYAFDPSTGMPLSIDETHRLWPRTSVTWRVAAFTNSTIHRIARADYLRKVRTTTWYLPLPRNAQRGPVPPVTAKFPGFENHPLKHGTSGLSKKRHTSRTPYGSYRVQAHSYRIVRDRRNVRKLKVTISMKEPNTWGGMFIGEYTVTAQKG
jgi:hypothetical protein